MQRSSNLNEVIQRIGLWLQMEEISECKMHVAV